MIAKNQENLIARPPIVVVLGHVDHGKSSLLEAIKDFKITAKESGGITQHIGAYQVEEKGKRITFIDTPGHEAFSEMRSRGAKVADVAILVIDAAEGVKPQTKEVISHIKTTNIPVIVVLNKMDKPEADPEKVKRELIQEDIVVESMGGKELSVEVSAQTKKGIPELLELILLVAEMENLTADPDSPAKGVVIESYLDNQRGVTATLLLTDGSLKVGDVIGTPSSFAKLRNLEDFQGKTIGTASPSQPVIVFGFNKVPKVGEEFKIFSSLEEAQGFIGKEEGPAKAAELKEEQAVLNLILKADVVGSLEAIEGILKDLPQDKVALRVIKAEVGNINESDLQSAKGGKTLILGFRVKADAVVQKISERERVRIMTFEVIYDLAEEVRKFMERLLKPETIRVELGKVKVLVKFLAEKNRQIVGGRVTEGVVPKGAAIEVYRSEEKIGQGRMVNLQRNKKDIDSVSKGDECGILFEGDVKIEEGDTLSFYKEEKQKGEL